MKPRSCGQRKGTSLWLYTVQAMVAESSSQSSRTKGVHEWITGSRIQATVEEQLHSHALHKCKHVPFVATHVTAPKKLCRIDWASSVRKQSAIVFQKCDSSKHPHWKPPQSVNILCMKFSVSSFPISRSVGDASASVFGRTALWSAKKKLVRALSVWADALLFVTTCVVRLVRPRMNSARSPEVAVSTSCSAA